MLHAASPEELGYTAARGGTGGLRGTLGGGFAMEHDCFARPVRAAGFPSASALRARLLAMPQLVCSAHKGALLSSTASGTRVRATCSAPPGASRPARHSRSPP